MLSHLCLIGCADFGHGPSISRVKECLINATKTQLKQIPKCHTHAQKTRTQTHNLCGSRRNKSDIPGTLEHFLHLFPRRFDIRGHSNCPSVSYSPPLIICLPVTTRLKVWWQRTRYTTIYQPTDTHGAQIVRCQMLQTRQGSTCTVVYLI